jgi:hypothetical protein
MGERMTVVAGREGGREGRREGRREGGREGRRAGSPDSNFCRAGKPRYARRKREGGREGGRGWGRWAGAGGETVASNLDRASLARPVTSNMIPHPSPFPIFLFLSHTFLLISTYALGAV